MKRGKSVRDAMGKDAAQGVLDDLGYVESKWKVLLLPNPPDTDESWSFFQTGFVSVAPGFKASVTEVEMLRALGRHFGCDWGDVCDDDRTANEEALVSGDRLFSVYHTAWGTTFWVITEEDRSSTRVLLPEEYRPSRQAPRCEEPGACLGPL